MAGIKKRLITQNRQKSNAKNFYVIYLFYFYFVDSSVALEANSILLSPKDSFYAHKDEYGAYPLGLDPVSTIKVVLSFPINKCPKNSMVKN